MSGEESVLHQAAQFAEQTLTRHLLDAIPGAVFVLNEQRRIVFANQAVYDLIGHRDANQIIGRRPGDVLDCRTAQEAEQGCGSGPACVTCGALMAILSGLEGEENVQECLLTRKGAGGLEHLTLRVWSSPVRFDGEQFTLLAGTDISHERRRLALERTFFHDVLNLLGAIRGYAELMEAAEVDASTVSSKIQLATQRVIDEIDAQRLLLAAEKGQLTTNDHLLSSRQVLTDLAGLYDDVGTAQKCRVEIDEGSEDLAFVGDQVLLGRILGNMLKNALEASRAGETVTLGCGREGDRTVFRVHNPAFIPPSHQSRVFQRDFSTKGSGRGLGTYSMRMLAQLFNGKVDFTSLEGEGTTFRLHLPASAHLS